MARKTTTAFARAIERLLTQRQNGIGSRRALASALADEKGTKPEIERRSVRRHLGHVEPQEPTIQVYAKVFGIERSALPAATKRPSAVKELRSKVKQLERLLAKNEQGAAQEDPTDATEAAESPPASQQGEPQQPQPEREVI